jgi:carboxymethylenebutenolidase
VCYNIDDRPPDPPVTRGNARGKDIVLASEDGTRFAAYMARATAPTRAQVLIYPDVRGLHQFYKELALRFAQVGINALALDYFGRTAGVSPRDEPFEFMPHVQQIQLPNFFEDVRGALNYLRLDAHTEGPIFTLGFCMGGGLSLLSGTQDFGLAGIIGFYAGLKRVFAGSNGSVLEQAAQIQYPVLGLFGGADQGIPLSEVQKLDEELDRAGVEHELITYPGAPHSFFDRKDSEFAEASTDAWRRVLDFMRAHEG